MSKADDFDWERRTVPLVVQCLEDYFPGPKGRIRPAGSFADQGHGVDFWWPRLGRTHGLAVRVRKAGFLKYKGDFTIREDRPRTGHRTELEKIRAGDWADFYVYAFSDGQQILHWSLFRMSAFDPDAPFRYMPGFGPRDGQDAVTRIYRITDQPKGFALVSVTPDAIPYATDGNKRIVA